MRTGFGAERSPTRRRFLQHSAAALSLGATGSARAADPVADFYAGKTIRFQVGVATGGATDFVARAVGAHLGRHVPGNPVVQIENVPGASSLIMTNTLYNRAPRDGTVIGMSLNGVVIEPTLRLMKGAGGSVMFDTSKLNWIGTPSHLPHVLWVREDSPARRHEDLKRMKVLLGAISPGSDTSIMPRLLNAVLGTKLEVVGGYQGVNEIFIAAERHEVQGCVVGLANLTSGRPDWLRDGKIRILLQVALERSSLLPDVPTALEIAETAEARDMLRLYATKLQAAFPIMMPPGVPAERVAAMREAFMATMKDPRFLDDAKRGGVDVDPLSGEDVSRAINAIETTPPDVIERLRAILGA